ncbi:UNVERIFIED_CONTAM: hypothetical protein K2H54_059818 [Gekko kuhli]
MASREEDGFLSLHETEPAGQTIDSRDRGVAKRMAAGPADERSSGTNPKRAKTATRASKEPEPIAAAILENRRRNVLSDGDGLQGPNPHPECPDAMSYSGMEERSGTNSHNPFEETRIRLAVGTLALYVYEYLLHVGAQKSAQTFLSEDFARVEKEPVMLQKP